MFPSYTFSGVARYRKLFFQGVPSGVRAPLAPLFARWAEAGLVECVVHFGLWRDVGTLDRLREADRLARRS